MNQLLQKSGLKVALLLVFLISISAITKAEGHKTTTELGQNVVVGPVTADHHETYHPLQLKLNESGSAYIRFIMWAQIWAVGQENAQHEFKFTPSVRRARLLAMAQMSDRFLIVTHFGTNSLGAHNMSPTGSGNASQVFLHDAWAEYKIFDTAPASMFIGAGLHYWNGLSRMSNGSTINMLTLDMQKPFFMWPTLGNSDQFVRHIGVYTKGHIGKLHYRMAFNDAMENSFDATGKTDLTSNGAYASKYLSNGNLGNTVLQGYFTYQFLDQESDKLPFAVGTYLGQKHIFNVGAGFFYHKDGMIQTKNGESKSFSDLKQLSLTDMNAFKNAVQTNDVKHFAADLFYDAPMGRGALTAYGAYYHYDYGNDAYKGKWTSNGDVMYGQVGFLLPKFSEKGRLQPYAAYSRSSFQYADQNGYQMNIGANWYLMGVHAKITAEYTNDFNNLSAAQTTEQFRIQAQIAL
ncbi:hypothetical protein [Persicobacter psychrovividus]|uniref:Short chain amide porin n=1 Tax=Persicobacter psychrovividus TaxID=387638 RepID=A0ABN6LJR5_9BACT|nr:hypothetical protein PEPS_39870 [Persicobacter psychrovividus]